MKRIYTFFIVISVLIFPFRMEAQGIENVIKFLTVYPNKKAVEQDSTIYPSKAIFTPIISYAPEPELQTSQSRHNTRSKISIFSFPAFKSFFPKNAIFWQGIYGWSPFKASTLAWVEIRLLPMKKSFRIVGYYLSRFF